MPETPITKRQGSSLVKLILIAFLVQLIVVGYVFYQSYEGRVNLVESQRGGCERAKLDRQDGATGWRIAEDARRSTGDAIIASRYGDLAQSLERRSNINCNEVFPNVSVLP